MAVHKFILKSDGGEMILPVTPQTFTVSKSNNVQKLSIHQLGDVNVWGQPGLCEIKIESFFPAEQRSYSFSGGDPYAMAEQIEGWINDQTVIRFIVSDTPVNLAVLPAAIEYGESDGTGDVDFTLTLKEYRSMETVDLNGTGEGRETENEPVSSEQTYEVKSGDTLWAIAKQYYGDGSLAYKLAAVNGIKNANLIYPGNVLKIPERGIVDAASYTGPTGTSSKSKPTVKKNKDTGKTEVKWPRTPVTKGGGAGGNMMTER